jgi:hypothetical protein
MGNSNAILTTRLQMLGSRRGCEMGKVSPFLCLDLELDPKTSFYMGKGWLFGWVMGYK